MDLEKIETRMAFLNSVIPYASDEEREDYSSELRALSAVSGRAVAPGEVGEFQNRFLHAVAEWFGVPVTLSTSLDDILLDDLDVVDLILVIDQTFDIQVDDDDIEKHRSLVTLTETLFSRLPVRA